MNDIVDASYFHGLTSEILDFTSVRGSTVDNLIHHLTFFGAALGRYPHVQWRGEVYADLNCILVGTSGCGKGESLGIINELYTFPAEHRDLLAPTKNTTLTSGKRTIQMISAVLEECQDGETRFLSIDEECSAQIVNASLWNNTLAQMLIKFIDGAEVSETCNRRLITIPQLHFGSIGHITPMALLATLRHMAFFNGLGNRFLFMGIPTPEIAEDDGSYPEEDMRHLREKLIESLSEGGARQRVEIDADAREVYLSLLRSLRNETCTDRIRALQQRMPVICLKLALTLALVNREESITRQTMEEACAIIDYSRKTIGGLFGTTQQESPEQVILSYLQEHGRTQRTPLMLALSSRLPRNIIDTALTALVSRNQVTRTTQTVARGRRPEFFELTPAVQPA
ncbi:DUF3987 domain-containing protein [Desulfovibrio sp. ZJ369]|uniref:DUF3987 domain-containing protein n=1 Tax=Desulfovibrio sp. ZJ369 TaxID=2709793 RepID=UPI0013EBF844|nr:DUF3987 domain-containing protein [Desulfovibrio sp. ZJ369]